MRIALTLLAFIVGFAFASALVRSRHHNDDDEIEFVPRYIPERGMDQR